MTIPPKRPPRAPRDPFQDRRRGTSSALNGGGAQGAALRRFRYERLLSHDAPHWAWVARDALTDSWVLCSTVDAARARELRRLVGARSAHRAELIDVGSTTAHELPPDLRAGLAASPPIAVAVAEHVGGETLSQRRARGPIEPSELARWGVAAARALHSLHELGAVHGAVSPRALVVAPLAGPPGPVLTQLHAPPALPYATQRLLQGGEPQASDDCYALLAVLFAGLAGTPPFRGTTARELQVRAPASAWQRVPECALTALLRDSLLGPGAAAPGAAAPGAAGELTAAELTAAELTGRLLRVQLALEMAPRDGIAAPTSADRVRAAAAVESEVTVVGTAIAARPSPSVAPPPPPRSRTALSPPAPEALAADQPRLADLARELPPVLPGPPAPAWSPSTKGAASIAPAGPGHVSRPPPALSTFRPAAGTLVPRPRRAGWPLLASVFWGALAMGFGASAAAVYWELEMTPEVRSPWDRGSRADRRAARAKVRPRGADSASTVGQCLRAALPGDAFPPDADLGYVCTEPELVAVIEQLGRDVRRAARPPRPSSAVPPADSTTPAFGSGAGAWQTLSWYQLPAAVGARGLCCPAAAPPRAPHETRACSQFQSSLDALIHVSPAGPGSPARQPPSDFEAFEAQVLCLREHDADERFPIAGAPTPAARAEFRALLTRRTTH